MGATMTPARCMAAFKSSEFANAFAFPKSAMSSKMTTSFGSSTV